MPDARNTTVTMSRATRRDFVKQAKLEADIAIINLLAGPIVEAHHRAALLGVEPNFRWHPIETIGSDIHQAFQIALFELCRGVPSAVRYMDEAAERVETTLHTDPRYWRSIRALADGLVEHLRLGHYQAVDLMRGAWNQSTDASDAN